MGILDKVTGGAKKGANIRFLFAVLVAAGILTFAVGFYVSQGWPGSSFLENNTPFA